LKIEEKLTGLYRKCGKLGHVTATWFIAYSKHKIQGLSRA